MLWIVPEGSIRTYVTDKVQSANELALASQDSRPGSQWSKCRSEYIRNSCNHTQYKFAPIAYRAEIHEPITSPPCQQTQFSVLSIVTPCSLSSSQSRQPSSVCLVSFHESSPHNHTTYRVANNKWMWQTISLEGRLIEGYTVQLGGKEALAKKKKKSEIQFHLQISAKNRAER